MTRSRRFVVVLVGAVLLLAMAVPAIAAPGGSRASVSGTLRGSDGVAIPGGVVTVSKTERAATSNATVATGNDTDRVAVAAEPGAIYNVVATLTTGAGGAWAYVGKAGDYRFDFASASSDPSTSYLTMENKGAYTLDVDLQSYGTIAGTITDSASGLPVYGASVEFYLRNSDGTWPTAPSASLITPDGTYASAMLPTGVYRVKASGFGYVAKFYEATVLGGATDLTVNRGTALTGIDVALRTAVSGVGTITGRVVRGATETPIIGTYVWFYRQNDDGSWPATSPGWGSPTKTVSTDSLGTYTSGDLPLGNYKVRFWGGSMTGGQWWQFTTSVDLATVVPLTTSDQMLTGIDGWFSKPL